MECWPLICADHLLTLISIYIVVVLDSIKSVTPSPDNNQWKVLILDDDSRKIVGSAVKMFDILEEGVDSTNIVPLPLHLIKFYSGILFSSK